MVAAAKRRSAARAGGTVVEVPVDACSPSPYQPRKRFDEDALQEMARTIKSNGVLQGVIVRPVKGKKAYEIVAGERRWRAAKLAGLAKIPAKIRQLSDQEAIEISSIENLQREDLAPSEQARAIQNLLELGMDVPTVAQRLGKSETWVADRLSLLKLAAPVQQMCDEGKINLAHTAVLLDLPSKKDQAEAARMAHEQQLTAVQLKARTQHKRDPGATRTTAGRARGAATRLYGAQELSRDIVSLHSDLQGFRPDPELPAQKCQTLVKQIGILVKALQKVQAKLS